MHLVRLHPYGWSAQLRTGRQTVREKRFTAEHAKDAEGRYFAAEFSFCFSFFFLCGLCVLSGENSSQADISP
jgi:hypothetical protein